MQGKLLKIFKKQKKYKIRISFSVKRGYTIYTGLPEKKFVLREIK
jgi:hypothetical protein